MKSTFLKQIQFLNEKCNVETNTIFQWNILTFWIKNLIFEQKLQF